MVAGRHNLGHRPIVFADRYLRPTGHAVIRVGEAVLGFEFAYRDAAYFHFKMARITGLFVKCPELMLERAFNRTAFVFRADIIREGMPVFGVQKVSKKESFLSIPVRYQSIRSEVRKALVGNN